MTYLEKLFRKILLKELKSEHGMDYGSYHLAVDYMLSNNYFYRDIAKKIKTANGRCYVNN